MTDKEIVTALIEFSLANNISISSFIEDRCINLYIPSLSLKTIIELASTYPVPQKELKMLFHESNQKRLNLGWGLHDQTKQPKDILPKREWIGQRTRDLFNILGKRLDGIELEWLSELHDHIYDLLKL